MKNLTCLIVDDHSLFAKGLEGYIREIEPEMAFVHAIDHNQASHALKQMLFDFIFVDIHLDDQNGVAVIEEARRTNPDSFCIAISGDEDIFFVKAMFAAGATSFISKKSNGSELRSAITKVLKRQKYVPVWMLSAKQPLEDMLTRLPPKLFQLSKMIAAGLSNKEIAVAQDTTENAVKAQIKRLYQHTDTLTRSEFIVKYAKALRHLEQIQSLD